MQGAATKVVYEAACHQSFAVKKYNKLTHYTNRKKKQKKNSDCDCLRNRADPQYRHNYNRSRVLSHGDPFRLSRATQIAQIDIKTSWRRRGFFFFLRYQPRRLIVVTEMQNEHSEQRQISNAERRASVRDCSYCFSKIRLRFFLFFFFCSFVPNPVAIGVRTAPPTNDGYSFAGTRRVLRRPGLRRTVFAPPRNVSPGQNATQ